MGGGKRCDGTKMSEALGAKYQPDTDSGGRMTMWCDLEALNLGESICPGAFFGGLVMPRKRRFFGVKHYYSPLSVSTTKLPENCASPTISLDVLGGI